MAKIFLSIPSLNQGEYLEATLRTLLDGNIPDIEAAVLDGGSTDRSLEIIRNYRDRLAFWRSHKDSGQSQAVNEGIRKADSAGYVGWINADDIVYPRELLVLAEFLEKNPGHVAVFGKAQVTDKGGNVIGLYPTRPFNLRLFAHSCTISQPASLIRKSAWDKIGGLDESLHYAMDYDLWWRLARIGKIGYMDEIIAQSRDHSETKTRTNYPEAVSRAIDVLRRHIGFTPISWVVRKIIAQNKPCQIHAARTTTPGNKRGLGNAARKMVKCVGMLVLVPFRYLSANGMRGILYSVLFMVWPRLVLRIRKA